MLVGIVTRHDLMHAIRDARQQVRRQLAQQTDLAPGQARGETVSHRAAEGTARHQPAEIADRWPP